MYTSLSSNVHYYYMRALGWSFCPMIFEFLCYIYYLFIYGEVPLENQTGEILGILVDGKFCLITLEIFAI